MRPKLLRVRTVRTFHLHGLFASCEHCRVHVITQRRLRDFWRIHPQSELPLKSWYKIVSQAEWKTLADLRAEFPKADYVTPFLVFDVGRNNYRVIAKVEYRFQKVFIAHVFTHLEY